MNRTHITLKNGYNVTTRDTMTGKGKGLHKVYMLLLADSFMPTSELSMCKFIVF